MEEPKPLTMQNGQSVVAEGLKDVYAVIDYRNGVRKLSDSRTVLEEPTEGGESPVYEI